MPWYNGNFPPSYKNQPVSLREKAVEITNHLLEQGTEEGIAIATGLKHARLFFKRQEKLQLNTKNKRRPEIKKSNKKKYQISKAKLMEPKDNFLNAQPSISPNDEAARADDLSTTDKELEFSEGKPRFASDDEDAFVNSVNDAEEIEDGDPGLDEEA